LGHEAKLFLDVPTEGRVIVFNAHNLPVEYELPDDAIIFNAEQVQTEGVYANVWKENKQIQRYLDRLKSHMVWDYSTLNISRLEKLGIHADLCLVGYWPGLVNIKQTEQDIDVLFVGSLNERRKLMLLATAKRKLVTRVVFGEYGQERDSLIARAKVVLN